MGHLPKLARTTGTFGLASKGRFGNRRLFLLKIYGFAHSRVCPYIWVRGVAMDASASPYIPRCRLVHFGEDPMATPRPLHTFFGRFYTTLLTGAEDHWSFDRTTYSVLKILFPV